MTSKTKGIKNIERNLEDLRLVAPEMNADDKRLICKATGYSYSYVKSVLNEKRNVNKAILASAKAIYENKQSFARTLKASITGRGIGTVFTN